jgi:hypothetical protein
MMSVADIAIETIINNLTKRLIFIIFYSFAHNYISKYLFLIYIGKLVQEKGFEHEFNGKKQMVSPVETNGMWEKGFL